jgi:hypothetical protein
MTETELNRLNDIMRRDLPATPSGDAQFRWSHTSKLFYFKQVGTEERLFCGIPDKRFKSGYRGGIWAVLPKYERFCWADRIGLGWVIAQWTMPMKVDDEGKRVVISEKAWERDFGNKFPYPHKGQFQPIENTLLPNGMEPDEQITRFAIHCAQEQIDAGYLEIYADEQAAVDKELAAQKAEMRDCITDLFPAFDNIPGKKYHVSFPTSN